jgi:AAA domain/HTH domain
MRRRGMGRAAIEAALLVENHGRCRPPLRDSEVAAIAASVARYDAEESIGAVAVEASPFELVTARELCELPDPPVSDELLGPLLVRGARTVLGAHTGEGKTTLALQLVQAVVMQREFLDWCGRGGRALVIDAEQGLRTIKRRLREAGLERSDEVDYLRVPDGLALDADGGDVARLEALLESGDYALVAADPLYKLHRGDSNEERHAVDLMRRLDQWRSRFGFALLMMVHRRKVQPSASGFSIDDLFGSGAYLRGAEVVLGLKRPSPGYARLYFFKDRDGDLPVGETWGLLFDRDDGFRRDPDDGKPKETARDKVRERLEAQPGLTLEQLAAATGVSERTVRKALTDLAAEHDTGKHGKKLWRLPAGDADEQ